jgi:pantoate--beta-alanine ligase
LNVVRADRAYFGEKDFQQLELVKGMARAFFLETQVIACPTVREVDGLAMSSRNVNLPPDARQIAPLLHRALNEATTPAEATKILQANGFQVDYVEDVGERRLAAARIGGVRLIDNVQK